LDAVLEMTLLLQPAICAKGFSSLTAAGVSGLRDEHTRTIEPARTLAAEALRLETELSNLVNQAYGLTPEEIALMWQTAPPRMPIPPPIP
jgi:hypothetical protein